MAYKIVKSATVKFLQYEPGAFHVQKIRHEQILPRIFIPPITYLQIFRQVSTFGLSRSRIKSAKNIHIKPVFCDTGLTRSLAPCIFFILKEQKSRNPLFLTRFYFVFSWKTSM